VVFNWLFDAKIKSVSVLNEASKKVKSVLVKLVVAQIDRSRIIKYTFKEKILALHETIIFEKLKSQ
jgi:hypothetical protein